jgi:hypothetical protein
MPSVAYPQISLVAPRSARPPALLTLVLALTAAVVLLFAVPVSAGDVVDTWKKRLEFQPQGVTGPVPVVVWVL